MERDVILFDGDCGYCDGWVKWIVKRDHAKKFRFAALASEEGRALIARYHIPKETDSVILISEQQAHLRSDAAWRILKRLPGWSPWGSLLHLVPRPLRNWGYDLVARNRHRLGGKDACEVPDPK